MCHFLREQCKPNQTKKEPKHLSDFDKTLMDEDLQQLGNQIKPEESANNAAKPQQEELKNGIKICKVCGKKEAYVQNMIKQTT